MAESFEVQLWAIRNRKGRRKPWEVRWRVGDRPFSRSFTTRALADGYRSRLREATNKGEPFSDSTGEPVSWQKAADTVYMIARETAKAGWDDSSGNTRKSHADGLCQVVLVALDPRKAKRDRPDGKLLRRALKHYAFVPPRWGAEPDDVKAALAWIADASLPAVALDDRETLDRVLTGITVSLVSGKPYARATSGHYRTALYGVCKMAVHRDVLDANPVDRVPRKKKSKGYDPVDPRTVPTHEQYQRIAAHIRDQKPDGKHLAAFFDMLYYSGCRPSEGIDLKVSDLVLPESGWGMAYLSGASADLGVTEGAIFNDGGERHDTRGQLKAREEGEIRAVPLHPYLVGGLRTHIATYGVAPDGRVFWLAGYARVTGNAYRRVWKAARAAALTEAEQANNVAGRVYDLRHGCASLLLSIGVSPTEVARRLGHSVQMLFTVYAHWLSDEVEHANKLIEAAIVVLPGTAKPQLNGTVRNGPSTGQPAEKRAA